MLKKRTKKKTKKKARKKAKRAANRVMPSGSEFQYIATAAMNPKSKSGTTIVMNNPHLLVLNAADAKKVVKAIAPKRKKAKKKKRKNPQLLVLSNPKSKEVAAAKKAFNRFHFKDPDKTFKNKVPSSWPEAFVVIGECEMFSCKANGKTVKRKFMGNGKMPLLCMGKGMKDVFIVGKKNLGVPAGNAVQVDYRVPAKSGRNKWARRWYHPHDTHPKVTVSKDGRYIRVSGPGLYVSPRGIIG